MIGSRLIFSFEMIAMSPLHIGNGSVHSDRENDISYLNEGVSDSRSSVPEIAEVMTDHQGRPYIPGSTLKGYLRRTLPNHEFLFGVGVQNDDDRHHSSGKVVFSNAYLKAEDEAGLEQATRVAINQKTGVAEKARLFTQDYVSKGARFGLSIVCPADLTQDQKTDVSALLSVLLAEDGISVGKGTRQALGRLVAFEASFTVSEFIPGRSQQRDVTRDWLKRTQSGRENGTDKQSVSLMLRSKAPFLISDPSRTPSTSDKKTPQIRGLMDRTTHSPLLTGATLLGALRARAAWLEAIWHPKSSDDKDAVLRDMSKVRSLTRTQRIFGITGWRGQIAIDRIDLMNNPRLQKVTSVRIDRFSAAPIDNALYTVEGWLAPEYLVRVVFDPRFSEDADDDWKFFQKVLAELTSDVWGGLDLGFGKARGFGAFSVEMADG